MNKILNEYGNIPCESHLRTLLNDIDSAARKTVSFLKDEKCSPTEIKAIIHDARLSVELVFTEALLTRQIELKRMSYMKPNE